MASGTQSTCQREQQPTSKANSSSIYNAAENDFNIFDGLEEFPYPSSLSNELFKPENNDVDKLLFENFKFVDLSELIVEISEILSTLELELEELIKNSTKGFIELSNSLTGGINLINSIKFELIVYQKKLDNIIKNLNDTSKIIQDNLAQKRRLINFQNKLNYYLVFVRNLNYFNTLIGSNDQNVDVSSLDTVTHTYLLLINLGKLNFIKDNMIIDINYKFNSFINDCLKSVLTSNSNGSAKETSDRSKYGTPLTKDEKNDFLLKLSNIFKLTNNESEFLRILKQNKS